MQKQNGALCIHGPFKIPDRKGKLKAFSWWNLAALDSVLQWTKHTFSDKIMIKII